MAMANTDDGFARVKAMLAAMHVEGEIIEHPSIDGSHSEDAARALGVDIGSVIKCLILVSRKGEPVAAIIGGDRRLDVKQLEAASGLKKLSMASAEVIKRLTGFMAGGVPPLAVAGKMPAFVDAALLEKPVVIGSAGSPRAGLKLVPSALVTMGFVRSNLS